MNIEIRNQAEDLNERITFPCREKDLQYYCDRLKIANTASTEVEIVSVLVNGGSTALHEILQKRVVKLDELNLFAKCIDRLDKAELVTFYATAYALQQKELKDLINLSFNGECYNVVDDLSLSKLNAHLNKLGKSLYLNENGATSTEELEGVDGRKYIEDMMRNTSDPIMTPYGIVYKNANELSKPYNGKCLPPYQFEETPITVCLNTKLDRDFLYLPCEQTEIDKSLQRLNCASLTDVGLEIENDNLPQNIADIVFQDIVDIDHLNEIAKKFKEIKFSDYEHIGKLVDYTKVSTIPDLKVLMDCNQEFEIFPNIHSNYDYGYHMIAESGRFEYDDNLVEYIDFEEYGLEKISMESGIFTKQGYLNYMGYNQDMMNILNKNIGMHLVNEPYSETLKLYMPLEITTYYEEDEYGRYRQTDYEGSISNSELLGYEDEFSDFLESYTSDIKSDRGLMEYYDKHDTVNAKVKSYHFEIEQIGRELYGVAVLVLNESLTEGELATIKEDVIGQAADGVGEGLSQQDFELQGRDVNIHLWTSDDGWYIKTAEELGITEQKIEMGGISQ